MLLSWGSGAAFGAASLCLDLLPFVPVLFLACPASVVRYGLLVLPGGLRVGLVCGLGCCRMGLVWLDGTKVCLAVGGLMDSSCPLLGLLVGAWLVLVLLGWCCSPCSWLLLGLGVTLKVLVSRSYSTTVLLTPSYSLGFCAAIFFCFQLVGGFLLACHYVPTGSGAFLSVDAMNRELDAGMIMRSLHANGASFFAFAVLCHMLRCIYHSSPSTRPLVWTVGVVIYLMLCGCCFTGYSLVYGQMSLWAMVVICSMVTAIPVVGLKILAYLWGGLVVSGATVNRFFCIHFILPLVLVVLVCAHLFFLHAVNSTGELGIVLTRAERCNFMPLLLVRDVAVGSLFFGAYGAIVCWNADVFGHADNYVPANPLVTPALIAPEWYFLPFYGLIRAIPQKALGVCVMVVYVASFFTAGMVYGHYGMGMLGPRVMLGLFLLDTSVMSYCCLCVNLAESVYVLLVASVLGMCLADFIATPRASVPFSAPFRLRPFGVVVGVRCI